MSKFIDLTGTMFGRLLVVCKVPSRVGPSGQKPTRWKCTCSCGETTFVVTGHLRSGAIKSCGCFHKDIVSTHGQSRHPLYKIWGAMLTRCSANCTTKYADRYYRRGIKVCDAWHNPNTFLKWARSNGWKKGLQLDRQDNNGNYCPENCRFVTCQINSCNKGLSSRNTSGATGIVWLKEKNKWRACIKIAGKTKYLGNHLHRADAISARNEYILDNNLPHSIQ